MASAEETKPGPKAARDRGVVLFFLALLIYSVCPPFTGYDSYWTVPTALSILTHGSTQIDTFVPSAPTDSYYSLECVPAGSAAVRYEQAKGCVDGHWYNFFPLAVSILALPMVGLIKIGVAILGPLIPRRGILLTSPILGGFLSGDFQAGHALVELWSASTFGAITVWLQFRIASRLLPLGKATFLTLLFAFGTLEWAVASRNLLQHGLTLLLLSAAVYLVLLAREEPSKISYVSIPLALAFTVRPSNAISVAVFTLFVAVHYRRYLTRYLLFAVPVAVLFFAYNLVVRHSLLPLYYTTGPPFSSPLAGLARDFFSPSRGLFIFTPIFIFSIAGMVLAWRSKWCFPFAPYLMATLVLHSILVALWWPGHCFGPRYLTDMTHVFIFFLAPVLLYWSKMRGTLRVATASIFLLLAGWSVLVQSRGATSTAVNLWSATPVSVDVAPWRVWDWKDPQFLRGLRRETP